MTDEAKELSRRTDPATSHLAAFRGVASGNFRRGIERAIYFVEMFPGRTARELSNLAGDKESGTIRKRLTEAIAQSRVVIGETRQCTVTEQLATTYYPADPNTIPSKEEHERRGIKSQVYALIRRNIKQLPWLAQELLERANGNSLRNVLSRLSQRCSILEMQPPRPARTPLEAIDRQIDRLPPSLDGW